jgi:hypothetical protein
MTDPSLSAHDVAADPRELSPAETRLLQTLLDRLGHLTYARSRMLFDETYALLGQAAKAYDASAFLASCAMTRAALEGALNTFATMKRMEGTDAAWQFVPILNRHGEVHSPRLKDLIDMVIERRGLPENVRPTMNRIADDGDLALHLVQRHFHDTVTYLADPETEKHLPNPKQWPTEPDARENISAVIGLMASLLSKMGFGYATMPSRKETQDQK